MIEVRPLGRDEASRLRELRLRALVDAPRELGPFLEEETSFEPGYWQAIADDSQRDSARTMLVADDGEGLVGMAGAMLDGSGTVDLVALWVDPAVRGRHVGRALIAAVIEWASARGSRSVGLWVNDDNAPARAAYLAAGFEPHARQPVPYAPEISETRFSVSLAGSSSPAPT